MIITLTGNLLAERTLVVSEWKAGKTQRATAESFQVGGKGVNVTKMLSRIGESTTAWCFVGGAAGQECVEWFKQRGLPNRSFVSETPTRTGVVIRESNDRQPETTFLAPDRPASASALRECAQALAGVRMEAGAPSRGCENGLETRETFTPPTAEVSAEQHKHSRLALCGSFPGWASDDASALRDELAAWAKAGRLDVDTYGPPLQWAIEQPVSLIKINRDEFLSLFPAGERGQAIDALLSTALERWPARAWVITDGPGEVYFADGARSIGRATPPRVKEVSATGSGDVVFACLLHALHTLKKPLAEAVQFALPYGAANAAHPGVAEFALNNLPDARSFPT